MTIARTPARCTAAELVSSVWNRESRNCSPLYTQRPYGLSLARSSVSVRVERVVSGFGPLAEVRPVVPFGLKNV